MSGNGGPATAASIFSPVDMAVDGQGNMYIADSSKLEDSGGDAAGRGPRYVGRRLTLLSWR
jgi:hypothetical protein